MMASETEHRSNTDMTVASDTKKRKIGYSKPPIPLRTIAPFTNNQPSVRILYPLSNYAFAPRKIKEFQDYKHKEAQAKEAAAKDNKFYKEKPFRNDQIPTNNLYFKNLKAYNDSYGTRRYLQFLIVVAGEKEPIVMVFKDKDQSMLPGGYLNHDESEEEGGKRLLKVLFNHEDDDDNPDSEMTVGETVGRWWRTDLKPNVYPYLPRHVTRPKELVKVVLVNLPKRKNFQFPETFRTFHPCVLVDLYDVGEPELRAIPLFLSSFIFNYADDKGEVIKEITQEPFKEGH